jgi:uncharacterized repeat protein (TIGR03803 family)
MNSTIGMHLIAAATAVLLPFGGAHAKSIHILYSFCSQPKCADGATPEASLVADAAGNLYGTTAAGGAHGMGTVFKLAPDGTEAVLYAFSGGADGGPPTGSLILDTDGNLYGTAGGGAQGHGVVFKLAPDGTETVLYAFQGGADGGPPYGSLIRNAEGDLYGVGAGGNQNCFGGCGAIFKVAPDGTETVPYAFCAEASCEDGEFPNGDLLADAAGNLYGTTQFGGGHGVVAAGTVFELTTKGKEKVLWSFCSRASCSDGEFPLAGLIRDSSGNLYGTTDYGGAPVGTVFRLAPDGTETVLYGFTGRSDGGNPETRLTMDGNGNLYGTTTEYGEKCLGRGGCGTIYKLAPKGSLKVLRTIGTGYQESSSFIIDNQGYLYGTTIGGGAQKAGTVFRIVK